jgi:hypothetical protein
MENRQMNPTYVSPMSVCYEMFAEGVLCQSNPGMSTEEWEVEDLSKM